MQSIGGRALASVLLLAGLLGAGAAPAAAAPAEVSWTVPLDRVDGDDANVAWSAAGLTVGAAGAGPASARTGQVSGYLVTGVQVTAAPVNRVRADLVASTPPGTSVSVEVRAGIGPQRWTEWTEAPAVLPDTTAVQVRIGLYAVGGATPSVRRVRLTAGRAESVVAPLALGNSYRIFATREGLVGGTTANGHVITSRDHFVALPSRRGLAPKDTGDYTVRVCAASGRCEWAPVWDVGPWNTTDDYWNPPSVRQSWTDLPQGKPEAQAAYQDGYNGGKDGFGRTVANPAGVDLADGTFWDGLKLADNAWVTVTYLWTGSGVRGTVRTSSGPLNVRSGPRVSNAVVGLAANYARPIIECQVQGDTVTGTYGTTNLWDRLAPGFFVSDAYMNTGSDGQVAPTC